MFEVPAAKRVKRAELFDHDAADEMDIQKSDTEHQDHEVGDAPVDYGFEYDFVEQHPTKTTDDPAVNDQPGEEAFQFNLFRPTSKPVISQAKDSSTTTQPEVLTQQVLISIRSPSPSTQLETKLIFRKERPESYYFTTSLPTATLEALRTSYAECAISAPTIQQLSHRSWPGTSLPWRILNLPAHRKQIVIHKPDITTQPKSLTKNYAPKDQKARPRARPSKKRRDLLQKKAQSRQRIIDESKTKEEHEREKKNRKNRERKLKRRAKERKEKEEKRAGGEIGDGSAEGEGQRGDDSGSDGDD